LGIHCVSREKVIRYSIGKSISPPRHKDAKKNFNQFQMNPLQWKGFAGMYNLRKSMDLDSSTWLILKKEADGHCGNAKAASNTTTRPMPHKTRSTPPAFRPRDLASASVNPPER
jgi:hypothetical protein